MKNERRAFGALWSASVLLLLLLGGCEVHSTPREGKPAATPQALASASPNATDAPTTATFETIVRYSGGARPEETLPLLVVLHGLGDTPRGFVGLYEPLPQPLRIVAVRAPTAYHRGFSWFPVQHGARGATARAHHIDAAADALAEWLTAALKRYPTRGKPLVSGFSQGGMLTFALTARHPTAFAAAFPIGGALALAQLPERAPADAPAVFAFHGEADPLVPFAPTRTLVGAMQQRGYRASINSYPELRHSISPALRADLYAAIGTAVASTR